MLPMDQKVQEGRFDLKSYFKRHNKLISFCGALIVFLTFIIKENLREEWQKTADSLDQAEYFYAVQVSNSEIKDYVRSLDKPETSWDEIKASTDQRRGGTLPETIHKHSFDLRSVLAMDAALANGEILLDILPADDENRKTMSEMKKANATLRDEAKTYEATINESLSHASPTDMVDFLFEDGLQGLRFQLEVTENEVKVNEWQSALLQDAKRTRDENAKRSKYAGWLSAVLYTLGWGLSLAGRIYGGTEVVNAN